VDGCSRAPTAGTRARGADPALGNLEPRSELKTQVWRPGLCLLPHAQATSGVLSISAGLLRFDRHQSARGLEWVMGACASTVEPRFPLLVVGFSGTCVCRKLRPQQRGRSIKAPRPAVGHDGPGLATSTVCAARMTTPSKKMTTCPPQGAEWKKTPRAAANGAKLREETPNRAMVGHLPPSPIAR